jgi:DMSO/TMAO reductase YedYZ molybdopterin-dependent catalytic subunit
MKRVVLFFFIILLLMFLFGCSRPTGTDSGIEDVMSKATGDRYSKLEIREYKGIKLDPSIGPRDNSISGIQTVDITSYAMKISGLVSQPISMTYDEILALPSFEKLITLHCVEGWDATVLWKGTLLKDIMDKAGVDQTANTVIFHCVDGYTTSLPLQFVLDKELILAYESNNITLPSALGYPFIVVAEDKLGYKWARWVNEIELSNKADYSGYWESRGYSNTADVPAERK